MLFGWGSVKTKVPKQRDSTCQRKKLKVSAFGKSHWFAVVLLPEAFNSCLQASKLPVSFLLTSFERVKFVTVIYFILQTGKLLIGVNCMKITQTAVDFLSFLYTV